MKSLLLALLLLATPSFAAEAPPFNVPADNERKPVELTGDFTLEWWQHVDPAAIAKPATLLTIGSFTVATKPLPEAKKSTAPKAAFLVGPMQSKGQAYGDKWYHFAVVRRGSALQLFLNGAPDEAGGELSGTIQGTPTGDVVGFRPTFSALDAGTITDHFKSALPPRSIVTVGHRGDRDGSPENTRISYLNAIADKTPIVEMDLRLTKDNVLVLLHDPTVNRTTNGKGKILDLTLADAQKLDAGSWKDSKYTGEQIPRVEDICNACRGKAVMMLDLKCTGLGPSLAELKKKLDYPSDGWIMAPWEEAEGVALRKSLPADIPMILLHSQPPENFDDAYFDRMKKEGFSGFSIQWSMLTQAFADAARKHDMKLYTWTVNDAVEIGGSVLANVDGIITDNVPRTMKRVSELTEKK